MPNIKSQIKRMRQADVRRRRNRVTRGAVITLDKEVVKLVGEKKGEDAKKVYARYVKLIDRAAAKNIIHWKKAARKKGRLLKKINALAGVDRPEEKAPAPEPVADSK